MKYRNASIILLTVCLFGFGACRGTEQGTLEQVTIVSRHGVRAPLKSYYADLDTMLGEGRSWTRPTVEGSHLTLRGAILEYAAGAFWQRRLDSLGMKLSMDEAYFAASPKHRTVLTAREFGAALFGDREVDVCFCTDKNSFALTAEPDFDLSLLDAMKVPDMRFLPILNRDSCSAFFDEETFRKEAMLEMREVSGRQDLDYAFLEKVLGLPSPYFGSRTGFVLDFGSGGKKNEPVFDRGSDIVKANKASDALVLQYYELEDERSASFGQIELGDTLSWERLANIKDAYGNILFTAPIVSVNIAHAMLKQIRSCMDAGANGRKFSFLASHDSMLQAVLAALRVEEYNLPKTIEKKTPIGFKLVIEKWKIGGKDYADIYLSYFNNEQVRESRPSKILRMAPERYPLSFSGLERQKNGKFLYSDVQSQLSRAIGDYDLSARGERPF